MISCLLKSLHDKGVGIRFRERCVQRAIVKQRVDDVKTAYSQRLMTIDADMLGVLKTWKQAAQFSGQDDWFFGVDAEYSFASYHAKTEVDQKLIRYTRTFEQKELSVPVARADELKRFYRLIASDERGTVVLKADTR